MNIARARLVRCVIRIFAVLCVMIGFSIGQNFSVGQDTAATHEQLLQEMMKGESVANEAELSEPSEWRFGVRVTAEGAASKVVATCPIPIDGPEQTIEVVSEDATDNIRKISVRRLDAHTSQMVVHINDLGAGEVAEATMTFRVNKTFLPPPEDPDSLSLVEAPPSKVKKFLLPSPYIESRHKDVQAAADSIVFDEDQSDWSKVQLIYMWVRDAIEYEFDAEIRTCPEALEAGRGDCEELSSLFIAICRAKGIPARAVWVPGHTYPEFYMEDADGNGHWFPCQAAGTWSFGTIPEARPILQKGDNYRLPGHPDPLRYVQPTLVAKKAEGNIGLAWINEPVEVEQEQSLPDTP